MNTTSTLSAEQQATLSEIAALMIPASAEHNIPSAADPGIMVEVLSSAEPDAKAIAAAIADFERAEVSDKMNRAQLFKTRYPHSAGRLETLIVLCYYRDARVVQSLGIEARPPFPKGYEVEQGDWSLLDPVRKMPPIYRPVD